MKIKKLSLNKETLQVLTSTQLEQVAGGRRRPSNIHQQSGTPTVSSQLATCIAAF